MLSSVIRACHRLVMGVAGPFLIAASAILLFNGFSSSGEELLPPPPAGSDFSCGIAEVLDGDTVDLRCPDGRVRLRLYGIDAPERSQSPWGQGATEHLQSLLRGPEFDIRVVDTDIYNRAVGIILDQGVDVGLRMVVDGWASVRTRYVRDVDYREARSNARRHALGIWSEPGLQQRPWEWRRVNPRNQG